MSSTPAYHASLLTQYPLIHQGKVRDSFAIDDEHMLIVASDRLSAFDVVMNDPNIEDISCDGPHVPVFVYSRNYEALTTTIRFPDHETLHSFVIRMAQRAQKHVSIAEPIAQRVAIRVYAEPALSRYGVDERSRRRPDQRVDRRRRHKPRPGAGVGAVLQQVAQFRVQI